jgi:hypothetical protein
MSDISIQRPAVALDLQSKPAQGAASDASRSRTAAKQQRAPADDPTDIITTSPAASAALGALNSQLSLNNTEEQKEFDAKQLKAAIQQLHLLQILGLGLGPEKLAKQTTDLAKQIAGIAKDYADNSGSAQSGAAPSPTASATSEADTAAAQANSAASTQSTGTDAANSAKTDADKASQTAKASADKAAQSAQTAAKNGQSAAGAATTPGAATPAAGATDPSASPTSSTSSSTNAATDPDKALADSPGGFFAEVTAAFKDLKKLETKALSALNLSPDQQKKKEAKKLGGEFNDAVLSTVQSANEAGVPPGQLADQTIDLSKVTINLSA